ncbi:MAG: hypothetical protein E7014_04410 [Alphaproteobacteria bacterium]|nr:hypothetical protein [Alphaproteobacteria bacterium]
MHKILKKVFYFVIILTFSVPVFATNYAQLDNIAKKLPLNKASSIESIVKSLTNNKQTDKEKARILAAYVAYQFQKNGYADKKIKEATNKNILADYPSSQNILKTRLGTSFDYAELYHQLCQTAGLESVIIEGYAGKYVTTPRRSNPKLQTVTHALQQTGLIPNYDMQKYEAAWNAVKVDNQWMLVDTYWMHNEDRAYTAKEIRNNRAMEKLLQKREQKTPNIQELTKGKSLNNDYFDANPRKFIKTHFPFDNQWQLLPVPVTLSSFLK